MIPPKLNDKVFRDQCMYTFQTPELPGGLNVCLHCFQAFAPFNQETQTNYTMFHQGTTGHNHFLNIRKQFQKELQEEHLKKKMKLDKLQVVQESEDDFYKFSYKLLVSGDQGSDTETELHVVQNVDNSFTVTNSDLSSDVKLTIEGILSSTSSELANEIEAWEQEIKPCKHSENTANFVPEAYTLLSHCQDCDLSENLWICLHCGNLGCGREQFGGLKGNSHALAHYNAEKTHSVAVKLGSLSLKSGKADCFCYECNDEVKVPNLVSTLSKFGINVENFDEKKEKSLVELNIQQNLTWQFNMESDSGDILEPLFGPELVGLKNLGNSCYINSTMQVLAHLKSFVNTFCDKDFYNLGQDAITKPYQDLYVHLIKTINGLTSSEYSKPSLSSTDSIKWQKGLSLSTFKSLLGSKNAEFNSANQQDAFEFLLFFFDQVEQYYKKNASKHKESSCFDTNPVDSFKFVINEKFVKQDGKFKIKQQLAQYLSLPICGNINESLDSYFEDEEIEMGSEKFDKKARLETLPDVLLVQMQRVKLVNWVPAKVDTLVKIANDKIDLRKYCISKSDAQKELTSDDYIEDKEDEEENGEADFVFDQSAMENLLQMGFPENRCKKALFNTGNSDAEAAMNWLFAHMEDADIDEPFVAPKCSKNANEPSADQVENLVSMGFNANLAKKALVLTNTPEEAVEWLFNNPDDDGVIDVQPKSEGGVKGEISRLLEKGTGSTEYFLKAVVCHKGSSVHTGHYVVFVKQLVNGKTRWVLYNDEKVVLASDKSISELEKTGYLYFFVRKSSSEDDVSPAQ